MLSALTLIEEQFDLTIRDEDYFIGREQLLHVFHHETLHAVISHKVPWIHQLNEPEETLVDEILVRVLNHHFVKHGKLEETLGPHYLPDTSKDIRDLKGYGITLSEQQFNTIIETWEARFSSPDQIEPMAQWLLDEHRAGKIDIHHKDTFGY